MALGSRTWNKSYSRWPRRQELHDSLDWIGQLNKTEKNLVFHLDGRFRQS
jgi:hypothetical protein